MFFYFHCTSDTWGLGGMCIRLVLQGEGTGESGACMMHQKRRSKFVIRTLWHK